MEDQHIVNPGGFRENSLFAVFDRHGGPEVAQIAKQRFQDILDQNQTEDKQEWLRTAFLEMDEELKDYFYEGCTPNVAYIDHQT